MDVGVTCRICAAGVQKSGVLGEPALNSYMRTFAVALLVVLGITAPSLVRLMTAVKVTPTFSSKAGAAEVQWS